MLVSGSIGTVANEIGVYRAGTNLLVGGKLGYLHVGGNNSSSVTVNNSSSVPGLTTPVQEAEYTLIGSETPGSVFMSGELAGSFFTNPLVDGAVLYTDSTHLKANANKGKYDLAMVVKSRADYWDDLDRAIDADRAAHGKAPLKEAAREPKVKQTKISRTDPEAGYMVRDGKPKGFFYLDHRTVDGRLGIITDTYATPANVHDSIVYLGRLDRQRERFGFDVGAVGLDAGYATSGIARGLEERGIPGVIGYRRPTPPRPGMMASRQFRYEAATDGYRCPQGQLLNYATTDRNGYRHYKSDPNICRSCPLLASCTSSRNATRLITRHVWADARERTDAHRLTPWGKRIYKRRKETVERSFADAKQLHGHRYARFRGLLAVTAQCLLAAAAQNIKKIALALAPKPVWA